MPFHEADEGRKEWEPSSDYYWDRTGGHWLEEPPCPVYYLAPFDDGRIKDFAGKWYVCRATSEADATKRAEDLREAIFRDEGTTSLARIPFLLTLMAMVHRNNVNLPNGRAKLYREIADNYVEKREATKGMLVECLPREQWECLAQVGIEMQLRRASAAKDEGSLFASGEDVKGWLTAVVKSMPERVPKFIDHLGRRTGLLMPRGEDRYSFIHLSFMEFFAAWYLKEQITTLAWANNRTERVPAVARRPTLRQNAAKLRWQVVLWFVCELLAAENKRDYLERTLSDVVRGGIRRRVGGERRRGDARCVVGAAGGGPARGLGRVGGVGLTHLRRQALAACCRAEVETQRRSFGQRGYVKSSPIIRILLTKGLSEMLCQGRSERARCVSR